MRHQAYLNCIGAAFKRHRWFRLQLLNAGIAKPKSFQRAAYHCVELLWHLPEEEELAIAAIAVESPL